MKHLLFLPTLCLFTLLAFAGEEASPLPFPVSIGGQAAQVKGSGVEATRATIEKPVADNAAIEVGATGDMIIINVVPANEQGLPTEGAAPAILLIQGGNKTTLDKTMDGKKFAPGNYAMAVVAGGKTASVSFKVQ